MSAWSGKTIIGLTGNIATGKSVVRKMMEHLGAYGIDADSLANRAIARSSPGFQPVVEKFGTFILANDGQIDRARLGRIVFSDPEALAQLEAIVHPLVREAIDVLVRRSRQDVVVIEAIKLIESGLADLCDSVWVTFAPPDQQIRRLTRKRDMSESVARQRMDAQTSQDQKMARADVIIRNEGSFEDTWNQVMAGWYRLVPSAENEEALEAAETQSGEVSVQRLRPRQAAEIAALISRFSRNQRNPSREDVMAAFGEKAFLLLRINGQASGLVGWKVENLVARIDDIYIDSRQYFPDAIRKLMDEVERASCELQCEISLIFLPSELENQEAALVSLGYQRRRAADLGVRAWEEAAQESMPDESILLFKQLRKDRVLRPV